MSWKRSNPNCNGNRRDSGPEDHLQQKCQIKDYQNMDTLLICRILLLQQKTKPGRMQDAGWT